MLQTLPRAYRVVFDNLYAMHWLGAGIFRTNLSCIETFAGDIAARSAFDAFSDRDAQRRGWGLAENAILTLATARLEHADEIDFLLDVFSITEAAGVRRGLNPHFALLVAGRTDHRRLERIRRRIRKLGNRVRLLSGADGPRAFDAADVYLTHSIEDPRSSWTLQAMRARLPILGPPDLVFADVIHPHANGEAFPRYLRDAAAKKILRLAAEPALRERYGRNSLHWLDSRPSPENVLDRWEELIAGTAELRERKAEPKKQPNENAETKFVDATMQASFAFDAEARTAST